MAVRDGEARQALVPEAQIDVALTRQRRRIRDRVRTSGEQWRDLIAALEVVLAVRLEEVSGLRQCRTGIDAAQHVVQLASLGTRVVHVVRRHDRKTPLVGERAERVDEEVVLGVKVVRDLDVEAIRKDLV